METWPLSRPVSKSLASSNAKSSVFSPDKSGPILGTLKVKIALLIEYFA